MVINSNNTQKGPLLSLRPDDPFTQDILKALASETRLAILNYLSGRLANVSEIASALQLPMSTANLHLSVLEEAGLITTELKPASRGLQKVCARTYNNISIGFPLDDDRPDDSVIEIPMPIGAFVDCEVTPTCGLLSETGIIGLLDTPASFYEPERINAQLIWFHHGYVEYRFPNRVPANVVPKSLRLSMEICSEAPLHHVDWPSDITLWINNVEVATWTSPADFGGERGILTPSWWESFNTQYGLLKVWEINQHGSYIDGVKLTDVDVAKLSLSRDKFISVRIGVKTESQNVGGINIFGNSFGNYPQGLVMTLTT